MLDRLVALPGGYTVAYPGVQFDAPNTGIWLEAVLLPNGSEPVMWSGAKADEYRGLMRVLVHFQPGDGVIPALDAAEAVVTHFEKGLTVGPAFVSSTPGIAPPVLDGAMAFVPVTIEYIALA